MIYIRYTLHCYKPHSPPSSEGLEVCNPHHTPPSSSLQHLGRRALYRRTASDTHRCPLRYNISRRPPRGQGPMHKCPSPYKRRSNRYRDNCCPETRVTSNAWSPPGWCQEESSYRWLDPDPRCNTCLGPRRSNNHYSWVRGWR